MSGSRLARRASVVVLLVMASTMLAACAPAPGPPAPGRQACPEQRARLAGQRVTAPMAKGLACADLRGAVLDGLDLAQADLSGADARGASFRGCDLTQANLSDGDFDGANFREAILDQADLSRGHFDHADLGDASLDQADLTDARLRGARLTNASLIQTTLRRADLRGAKLWWVNSIQADTSETKIDLIAPGIVQLGPLIALVLFGFFSYRCAQAIRRARTLRAERQISVAMHRVLGALATMLAGQIITSGVAGGVDAAVAVGGQTPAWPA